MDVFKLENETNSLIVEKFYNIDLMKKSINDRIEFAFICILVVAIIFGIYGISTIKRNRKKAARKIRIGIVLVFWDLFAMTIPWNLLGELSFIEQIGMSFFVGFLMFGSEEFINGNFEERKNEKDYKK